MKATFTKNKKNMFSQNFNYLLDSLGISLTIPAIFLNIINWLFNANVNQFLTIIISLLSCTWIILKIIDQNLSIKIKKKKLKDDDSLSK